MDCREISLASARRSAVSTAAGLGGTWPGIGFLYITAIQQLDYPVIMAVSMTITVMLIVATLLTDIAYVFIDPRMRLE
mgnify:CR=1 FL=1